MTTIMDGNLDDVEAMSAEDMRNALYERLHNKGLLDSLKKQLRNYLVSELSGKGYHKSAGASHISTDDGKHKLQKKVIDSLIYRYMCDNGYDYSVGVFLPEVEMTKREVLSGEELVRLLNIPKVDLTVKDKSLLQVSIDHLMRKTIELVNEEATQTDSAEPLGYLTDKLSNIDMEYLTRSSSGAAHAEAHLSGGSIEERLLQFQRRAEQSADQKALTNFERWKKLELEVIQVKERERISKEMQGRRTQLEEEYRRKMAALTEREKSLSDSVKIEYEAVQRETYQQRQQILQQSEELRKRENELRDQKDYIARQQRLHDEKLEQMEQMLKKREKDVTSKELHLENTLRSQSERCRLEEKLAYDTRYRELKALEERVKDKEQSVEREKRNLLTQNERTELSELRQKVCELDTHTKKSNVEVASLEMKITGLQERLAKVYDYDVIKESNISLKKDLEITKDRLDSLLKEHTLLQEKYEHVIIDGKDKPGLGEIMLIKTQMQRERDKALDDKVILEHRLKEMEDRLTDQMRKNHSLVKEYELQTEKQRFMNKEYSDMRRQLGGANYSTTLRGSHSQRLSPAKEPSFYDTTFRKTCPELALEADWTGDSSCNEVSTATEESVVTETRKRLNYLAKEADNLHSAYQSLTRASPTKPAAVATNTLAVKAAADSVMPSSGLPVGHRHLPYERATYTQLTATDGVYELGQSVGHQYAPESVFGRPIQTDVESYERHTRAGYSAHHPAVVSVSQSVEPHNQGYQLDHPTPNKSQSAGNQSKPEPAAQKSSTAPEAGRAQQSVSSGSQKPGPLSQLPDNQPSANGQQVQSPPTPVAQQQSLADKWKTAVVSEEKTTLVSLDSQWKAQDADREVETSLEAAWKSGASPQAVNKRQATDEAAAAAEDVSPPAAPAVKDDLTGIDPVMQKYMKMIQQQKSEDAQASIAEKTSTPSKPSQNPHRDFFDYDNDEVSDHVSLAKSDGGATDEDFW